MAGRAWLVVAAGAAAAGLAWMGAACRGPEAGAGPAPGDPHEVGGVLFGARTVAVEGSAAALVDLDGDGLADLVTPHDRAVGVRINASRPGLVAFEPRPAVAATTPFAVELADLDGDGHLDLVSASGEGDAVVEVFVGDGLGGFIEADRSPLRLGPGGKALRAGDFNGDGVADVLACAYHADTVLVILGGPGGLSTARLPAGGARAWGLAAGDANADGVDDMLIIGEDARVGRLYLSQER